MGAESFCLRKTSKVGPKSHMIRNIPLCTPYVSPHNTQIPI